jgi:hypothetical protein
MEYFRMSEIMYNFPAVPLFRLRMPVLSLFKTAIVVDGGDSGC